MYRLLKKGRMTNTHTDIQDPLCWREMQQPHKNCELQPSHGGLNSQVTPSTEEAFLERLRVEHISEAQKQKVDIALF